MSRINNQTITKHQRESKLRDRQYEKMLRREEKRAARQHREEIGLRVDPRPRQPEVNSTS